MTKRRERVFVAGHLGMVGSSIVRQLSKDPDVEIVVRARSELDLTSQAQVLQFFEETEIDQVYLAAAKVGGIHANSFYPAEFAYQNMMIECNVIHSAFLAGVRKLLFLGSSCIYPRMAEQPIDETALLTGQLEATNEPYAIAKIAGIKLCESYNRQYGVSHRVDYRSLMPANLYGPGDNYHPENSHVIPGLIRRFHDAKKKSAPEVVVWGTGLPKREFLFVDDLARAAVHVMALSRATYLKSVSPMCSHLNVGFGSDVSIYELASEISRIVGFGGAIKFDPSKPDGTPKKLMSSMRIKKLGWQPQIGLEQGLRISYEKFLETELVR